MKTIAISIDSSGVFQGVYEIEGSPHERVIVVEDRNLGNSAEGSDERQKTALKQLEGYDFDGHIEYNEIHSELSNYISSDDVYEPLED